MQKFLGTALAWAVLSVRSLSALGQSGADQPPAEQPSTPTAMTTPSMTGPLAANPNPTSVDAGFLGPVYVTGAVSGLGLWQNNKFPDQQHAQASLSNGQVFLQKTEGLFQYYLDVGAYTIPTLGAPYFSTATTVGDLYGPVPVAWAKIAPTDNFYIQGGKLPTLIGAENVFTFQNMNIERGLLFAQEPTISRGGQLGYTQGPLALALSWNDGFYSNRYTWLSGSATYTFDPANSLVLAAGGNFAHTAKVTTTTPFFQTTAVPLFQNNETLFTLSYTYNSAPWTVTPYFQFTHVPQESEIGAFSSASTIGGAILANYSFGEIRPYRGSACRSASSTSVRPAAPPPARPISCMGPAATRGRSLFRRRTSTRSSSPALKFPMSALAAPPPGWSSAPAAPTQHKPAACWKSASCSKARPLVGLGSFFAEILGINARSIWILYADLSTYGVAGAIQSRPQLFAEIRDVEIRMADLVDLAIPGNAQAAAEALGLTVHRDVTTGSRVRQIPREEAEIAVECLRDWGIAARILDHASRGPRS